MKLAGATALVTGASNGIGRGTARVMASHGTRVALVTAPSTARLVPAAGAVGAPRHHAADDPHRPTSANREERLTWKGCAICLCWKTSDP